MYLPYLPETCRGSMVKLVKLGLILLHKESSMIFSCKVTLFPHLPNLLPIDYRSRRNSPRSPQSVSLKHVLIPFWQSLTHMSLIKIHKCEHGLTFTTDECEEIWTGGVAFGDSRINTNWRWNVTTNLKPLTYFNWATEHPEPNYINRIQDKMYMWRKYDYKWGDNAAKKDYLCLICEYNLIWYLAVLICEKWCVS